MSEAVQLSLIAVVASLLTGTIVVAVGVWADVRRKRSEAAVAALAVTTAAKVAAETHDQRELVQVRDEYRLRIDKLEARLDAKDQQIAVLTADLGRANVTIAQQAARIAEMESDLAALHQTRLQGQRDRIEENTRDTNERVRSGEIGQGERAVVDRALGLSIQETGEDSNRILRQAGSDEPA